MIPIIYAINSAVEITERNAFIRLSSYVTFSQKCILVLFQSLICLTLGYYINGADEAKKQFLQEKMVEVFNQVNRVDTEMEVRIYSAIEKYINAWGCHKCEFAVSIVYQLEEILDKAEKGIDNIPIYIKREISQLYDFLKQLLEMLDISVIEFPELTMVQGLPDETHIVQVKEYDKVIDFIEQCRNDRNVDFNFVIKSLIAEFEKGIQIEDEAFERIQTEMKTRVESN